MDRAQVQLESAPDPETVAIYRRLVADLERIAGIGGQDAR